MDTSMGSTISEVRSFSGIIWIIDFHNKISMAGIIKIMQFSNH